MYFFLNFCYQRLRSIEKNFQKYIIDVKFLKESIPCVIYRLATRGFPNLKMSKNRFFFIIRHLISRIFVIFLHVKTFVFSLFSSPNNNFDVPFRPTKYKKTKNAFEFPAKTRVNMVMLHVYVFYTLI